MYEKKQDSREEPDEEVPFFSTEEEKQKFSKKEEEVPWDPPPESEDLQKYKLQYTIVNHRARKELHLTLSEYCVLDSIRAIGSIKPEAKGWCYASKEHLADFLNLSKRAVYKALDKGVEKGYLERRTISGPKGMIGLTRTTALFNCAVIMTKGGSAKSAVPTLQKVQSPQCTNGSTPSAQSAEYKDSFIRSNNKDSENLSDLRPSEKTSREEDEESHRRADQENREAAEAESKYPDDLEAQKFFNLGRKTGTGEELKDKKIGDIKKELKQKELVTTQKQG